MSFAADQSAPMVPEPMNAAEIQLALQKLNVLGACPRTRCGLDASMLKSASPL